MCRTIYLPTVIYMNSKDVLIIITLNNMSVIASHDKWVVQSFLSSLK